MTSRAYTSTTYTRSNYDISTYNFTKATGKTWRITNRSSNSGVSTNIMFSNNLVGTTGQFNKGILVLLLLYLLQKLYENFVNSNGQKLHHHQDSHKESERLLIVKRTLLNKVAPCQIPIKQTAKPISSKVGTKAKPSQHLDHHQSTKLCGDL